MRSKVATNAANTASIDEEFSAFFDQGDAGDYVGGLSESPLSVDPVTFDEPKEGPIKSTGRRVFFAKVVTVVVAGCATLMIVAVGVKSLPSLAHARQAAGIAGVARNRVTLSIATPKKEIGAVATTARPELPPAVQREQALAEPVLAELPQVAAVQVVQETIAEPVLAKPLQVAPESLPKLVTSTSGKTSPKEVKPIGKVLPVKAKLDRSISRNSHSSEVSSKIAGGVRQSSVTGSKPSVVAFPVD